MTNNLCWIRRDLRLIDHHALSMAAKDAKNLYLFFNFDPHILGKLKPDDRRVTFIIQSLKEIELELNKKNASLIITYGDPQEELSKIVDQFSITKIFHNRDYEPYAKSRDEKIAKYFKIKNVEVLNFKDHVFYEKHEILNEKKEIYKVFTPYKNKWLAKFRDQESHVPKFKINLENLAKFNNPHSIINFDWYKRIGFMPTENVLIGGRSEALKKLSTFKKYLSEYKIARDYPSLEKTSNLSPYLRMGCISIREAITFSLQEENVGAETFLSELIWREFYQMILDVFPRVEKSSFKINYDQIKWENNQDYFEKWKMGMTGYPLIDASMRCLNETGLMHNRLRMVVASFLTKTLLVDWRLGEAYFAEKLLDFDLAANNGGWQWSASTGVDAQPYFRIFNPYNQSEKFDEYGDFIKIWCPELKDFDESLIHYPHEADMVEQASANCRIGMDYPHPIVSYKVQKNLALKMFAIIKQ